MTWPTGASHRQRQSKQYISTAFIAQFAAAGISASVSSD